MRGDECTRKKLNMGDGRRWDALERTQYGGSLTNQGIERL